MNNSIIIKDWGSVREERSAAEAITPGQFLIVDANGDFAVQATAGVAGPTIVALEDGMQGKTIEDDYAAEDRVQAWVLHRGDQVLAKLGSGFNPAVGDLVQLAGNGGIEAHDTATPGTSFPGNALFQVVDAEHQVDDASNHRIIVEAI